MPQSALFAQVLRPDGRFVSGTLKWEGERIVAFEAGAVPGSGVQSFPDHWLLPGFIDLQLNGGYGHDFTTYPASARDVAARLPATGVTAFLPTIITSPFETYPARLATLAQQISRPGEAPGAQILGAQILGMHLEGPYLSPHRPGAHQPAWLRTPDVEEITSWVAHHPVRLVTLAPELPGALEAIAWLQQQGILVSAGHSLATYDQTRAAFAAGVGMGTHLYNAMPPLGHREPGLVGCLLDHEIPAGIIPDGIHVHPAMVRLAYRLKGPQGLLIVTDGMAALGMPPGKYALAGNEVTVNNDSARLKDGTLAGSIITMDEAIRRMLSMTGCSLAEAAYMASTLPAGLLRLGQTKGKLAPGYDADWVLLDTELRVVQTIGRGTALYCRSAPA